MGTFLVTSAALIAGALITWLVIIPGPGSPTAGALGAMFVASLVGVASYGALFLFVSLVIPRALLVGVIYILMWESLLARFIPGIRVLSIRHFIQSIFVHLLRDSSVSIKQPSGLAISLIVMAFVVAVSLAFASFRLRQMNLD